jgi:glycosyltransferase involved in cell wall biosynthesis
MPELSIIIPWCDRPELATTLRENCAELHKPGLEVLVVNCGGDRSVLGPALAQSGLPSLRLVSVPHGKFNKSLALNMGAHHAAGTVLFFLDADILLPQGTLTVIRSALYERSFVTVERVIESEPTGHGEGSYLQEIAYKLDLTLVTGRTVTLETNRVRFTDGSRGAPGLILLRRSDFLGVNGMNSELEAWGWEDLDLVARLELGAELRRLKAGAVTHLTHGDSARVTGEAGRGASERLNFARCLANYLAGNVFGTYREDLANWDGETVCECVVAQMCSAQRDRLGENGTGGGQ